MLVHFIENTRLWHHLASCRRYAQSLTAVRNILNAFDLDIAYDNLLVETIKPVGFLDTSGIASMNLTPHP